MFVAGRGIVFNQPSLCSFVSDGVKSHFLAAGDEARAMLGRTPSNVAVAQPLRHGVLTDVVTGRELIRYAIRRASKSFGIRRPRIAVGIPADATAAEREAFKAVARDGGAGEITLIDEPLAAALGAGLPIGEPVGSMIVDCGSSTTEVAVTVLGNLRVTRTVRIGGETLDAALMDHLNRRHRFSIGPASAEQLKLSISALDVGEDPEGVVEIKGLDRTNHLPVRREFRANELVEVLADSVRPIIAAVRSALAVTPPDLCDDILNNGIVLTGGNAMTAVIGRGITRETGLVTTVAERPLDCVALGLGAMLDS